MDHRKQNYTDPWDDQVYGTGNTMPPKSYSGIIALLLILVIFLSGVVSLLSFMNIKLFRQLSEAAREEAPHAPVSFSDLDIQPFPEMTAPTESLTIHSDVSISLNQSPQSIENIPQEGALSLQEIYEKNAPSVVSVICTGPEGSVTGTGVVLSRTGYILTTYFTVHRAESIDVHTHDGRSFQAQLLGGDLLTDLAVLKVDSSDLTPAEFGASGALRVGDAVCAIGDPLGAALGGSLSEGIISAIHTNALSRDFRISLIQSSAVPSTGTPGGPLINCYGQVVGIHTHAYPHTPEDYGFVIPSASIKQVAEQLIAQGYVSGRPTLGITGDPITQFEEAYFHIPRGLYITQVEPGTDAWLLGIEPGTILLEVNGTPVTNQEELHAIVNQLSVGDTVTAEIYLDGQQQELELTLAEYTG
jgi:serine protease Do